MYIIIGIIVLVIAAFALKKVHDKHHGGGGCIRDCKNCAHPCHHKGRF